MSGTSTKNPTFTITSKLIGQIVEQSYETRRFASQEELEDDLRTKGEYGRVSYYLYGKKGTERGNLTRMAFI